LQVARDDSDVIASAAMILAVLGPAKIEQRFETDPFELLAPHLFAKETGVSCERDRRFESIFLQRRVCSQR
jgi:hypothetical protein